MEQAARRRTRPRLPLPTSALGAELGSCAITDLRVVAADAPCAELDAMLRTDPQLSCVAVADGDRVGLVMRDRFQYSMSGPFGYGRALWGRRPVSELTDWSPLILPAGLPLLAVSHRLRRRSPASRYDDVLVEFDSGLLGRAPAAAIFDALAVLLARQAVEDSLTGVANRAMFMERLASACAAGQRTLVAYVDLDGMKRVNDTMGHNVGDLLLIRTARQLVTAVGADGLVARLGGDEFAVLCRLPDGDTGEPGERLTGEPGERGDGERSDGERSERVGGELGERLRAAVASGDGGSPHGVRGRASVGVAVSGPHADPATLLSEADMAMYQAKQAGGDAVVVVAGVGGQLRPPRELAARTVRQALAADELLVVYQPIVRIVDGALAAVEALVRWQHPHLGLLSPDRFLPGAEQAGHLPSLDRWVLDRACADLADWVRRLGGSAPARVNVNVSVPTLGRPGLDRMVLDAAARAGVEPGRLRIELPERADLAALTGAREQLECLHRHGVAVALDDMGAGASTLRHLSVLSVTELKIDRSFTAGVVDNDRDRAVVRLLADLGHTLGLGITAEGVERADQLAELERLGVGFAQGYHLGRPLLADQLATTLESGRWLPRR